MFVTIKEAAARLNVSQDTIRRRLKAGEFEGMQEPTGSRSGFRWLVEVPDDEPEPQETASQAEASADLSATAYERADARARIEGLERLVDNLASERDNWQRQAEAAQRLADQAQHLIGQAQQIAIPAQTGTYGPPAPQDASQTNQGRSEGTETLWDRIRRVWNP